MQTAETVKLSKEFDLTFRVLEGFRSLVSVSVSWQAVCLDAAGESFVRADVNELQFLSRRKQRFPGVDLSRQAVTIWICGHASA